MSAICPFCDYAGPSPIIRAWEGGKVIVFKPLNPVTPGHLLVVPRRHVEHFGSDRDLSALVMRCAADLVAAEMMPTAHPRFRTDLGVNVITSAGESATQTVKHLHVHIVPRRRGDDLKLPWSGEEDVIVVDTRFTLAQVKAMGWTPPGSATSALDLVATVRHGIGLARSIVQCGEEWTPTADRAVNEAYEALEALAAAGADTEREAEPQPRYADLGDGGAA